MPCHNYLSALQNTGGGGKGGQWGGSALVYACLLLPQFTLTPSTANPANCKWSRMHAVGSSLTKNTSSSIGTRTATGARAGTVDWRPLVMMAIGSPVAGRKNTGS